MRGATQTVFFLGTSKKFQSTRPMRGATAPPLVQGRPILFQSTRPMRGATWIGPSQGQLDPTFQSTRPMRGATPEYNEDMKLGELKISIHAPHAGRDEVLDAIGERQDVFQSTRPMRGATQYNEAAASYFVFQSTRPMRGATAVYNAMLTTCKFQSTRPMRGATGKLVVYDEAHMEISIHAPHAGRDWDGIVPGDITVKFQSTRPMRGATSARRRPSTSRSYFNPRAPCGARLLRSVRQDVRNDISIHAPHAGRDVVGVATRSASIR